MDHGVLGKLAVRSPLIVIMTKRRRVNSPPLFFIAQPLSNDSLVCLTISPVIPLTVTIPGGILLFLPAL